MKRVLVVTLAFAMIAFLSCGEKFDELKQVAEMVEKAPDMAQNIEKSTNEAEKRLEERRAKGDTLAVNFSELLKYLPESLEGYTAEKPEGQTTNTQGFSLSTAKRVFYKENADGYSDYVTMELADYNQGYGLYAAMTIWVSMGMSIESTEGWQKTFDTGIDGVYGLEDYKHEGKRTTLTYSIGYRFYLTISVDNVEGTDFAKNLAKKIDMKALAKM